MTDSLYDFKTPDWKDKPINTCDSKIKSAQSRSSLKKTDLSENLLSSFTLIKFIGQEA